MVNRNFIPFPILKTVRLTLRALSVNDQQDIFLLRSNKEVNKYLDRETSSTIEDAINFIKKINENIKISDSIYWVITLTKSKTFVGTICLYAFSNDENKCEIGYELLTNFQGQGIMKEATEKIINYAFATIKIKKVEAFSHKKNKNSTKLLKKLGFTKSVASAKENPDLDIFALTNSINDK